ncbi:hypothetical protein Taro_010487 [Colocasia esculenta]|uniref:Uncharacterized protein n=1 Tax=Colocasia esculenta TaxID=4460 RepID=A0A843U8D8_COLES|nr:hypothetical protein [Colocasia esculenta]
MYRTLKTRRTGQSVAERKARHADGKQGWRRPRRRRGQEATCSREQFSDGVHSIADRERKRETTGVFFREED